MAQLACTRLRLRLKMQAGLLGIHHCIHIAGLAAILQKHVHNNDGADLVL